MDSQVRTRFVDERAVVQVTGDLDVSIAPHLRAEVHRVVDNDQRHVLVDLSETRFIDSTGMGALVGALKATRNLGGRLELILDDTKVMKVLRIAGLASVFVIHPDLRTALESTI
jgi:anti-sigma B factor antagonist